MTPGASPAQTSISIVVFVIPAVVSVVCFILVYKVISREKEKARQAGDQYRENGDIKDMPTSPVLEEVGSVKYVLALCVCWCLLQAPHHLVTWVEDILQSNSHDVLTVKYHRLKVTLTWLRFSHVLVLPVITYCWRKDVWKRCKNVICCHKSNLIKDATPRSADNKHKRSHFRHIIGMKKFGRKKSSRKVPMLYAAENGLCLQTYDKSLSEDSTVTQVTTADMTIVVTSRNCDVQGSVPDFIAAAKGEEDTSDYDSQGEVDQLPSSNLAYLPSETQIAQPTKSRSRQNSESRCSNSDTTSTFVTNVDTTELTKDDVSTKNGSSHVDHRSSITSSIIGGQDPCSGSMDAPRRKKSKAHVTPAVDDSEIIKKDEELPAPATEESLSDTTPKKRKRKKKKIGQLISQNEENEEYIEIDNPAVELPQSTPQVDSNEAERKPPARLKPIEPKPRALPADPKLPVAKLRTNRQKSEQQTVDRSPRRQSAESSTSSTRAKGPKSTATNSTENAARESVASGKKERVHRTSTSDSESPLINSSCTSNDLSDISSVNSRARTNSDSKRDPSAPRKPRRPRTRTDSKA